MIPAMLAKLMSYFLLGVVRFLTGSQARWYGCPPKAEQRIYFANHQSHADMVLIWAALPEELRSITRPIAAKDYWTKTPFKQWITTAVFNAVYVDRQASPARTPALRARQPRPRRLQATPPRRWTAQQRPPPPVAPTRPPSPPPRPRPKPCALRCLKATRSPRWCGRWRAGIRS